MDTSTQTDIKALRRELSAALRLADRFGFNEAICNHFSVVVPGDGERYLINAHGLHWSEIGPDQLLLIDGDGNVLEGDGEVEQSARFVHVCGHRANPRHQCLLHTHMPYATALTLLDGGRLEMAHQTACKFFGRTEYQSHFGGVVLDEAEGDQVAGEARANPDADIIFLAHHGVVVGGPSVAHAFDDLYYLERACRQQVLAQSTGLPLKLLPDEVVRRTAGQIAQQFDYMARVHFDALMRVIDA